MYTMERRKFLKTAGEAALISPVLPLLAERSKTGNLLSSSKASEHGPSSVQIRDDKVIIETSTLSGVFSNGFLTSLKSKPDGEEFITSFDDKGVSALQIVYPSAELVDLGADYGKITLHQVSDHKAEVIFQSWHGDGLITISTDDETGDLIIEPSAYSLQDPECLPADGIFRASGMIWIWQLHCSRV